MTNKTENGLGPRLLVIDSVLRTLMEHASATDPTIPDRVKAKVEAYLANLATEVEDYGEIERDFTEKHAYASHL